MEVFGFDEFLLEVDFHGPGDAFAGEMVEEVLGAVDEGFDFEVGDREVLEFHVGEVLFLVCEEFVEVGEFGGGGEGDEEGFVGEVGEEGGERGEMGDVEGDDGG